MGLFDFLTKPSPAKFARVFAAALRDAVVTGDIRFDEANFRLVIGDDQNTINLHNFYADYCAKRGAERRGALARAVHATAAPPDIPTTFDDAKPHLLPRVRERSYVPLLALQVRLQHDANESLIPEWRPFAESFSVSLALDYPDMIAPVSPTMLRDWGVSFDDAMAVARDNLWNRSTEDFELFAPGLYVSPWEDDQDPSRLYLPDLIRQIQVRGRHVAAAPHRSHLLVTGEDDLAGLARLIELVDEIAQKEPHRFVSSVPLVLEGDKWKPYLPPAGHPLYAEFRKLHIRDMATQYDGQKELLEAIHAKTGEDVFVASVMVTAHKDDGVWRTSAVWGEGVDSLLPEVESIMFARANKDMLGPVAWTTVREIVGDLMEATEMVPIRWRVRRSPSADQLTQLRATSSPGK